MRDLQSADERECRDIFTAVGNFSELILKKADARLEDVALSHFDCEEEVVILLDFPTGDVLGEERFGLVPQNCRVNTGAENKTTLKPHLSDWMEMSGAIAGHCENRPPSYLKNTECAR